MDMAVEVKIQRKPGLKQRSGRPLDNAPPPPQTPLKQRLAADLPRLLPADAFAFAVADEARGLPAILIIHRGRALGLELSHAKGHLGDEQRTVFPRLRAAGMRIEVARSFGEALAALREMGLELTTRESLSAQVAELFRQARRPA